MARASCGSPRCMVLSSDRSRKTFPRSKNISGGDFIAHRTRPGRSRLRLCSGRIPGAAQQLEALHGERHDSYHASILHLFFTTFERNWLSQMGAIIVDESGGHHVSYSAIDREAQKDAEYSKQQLRSESQYKLADSSLLQGFDEYHDGVTLQILSVFPTFVLQQIRERHRGPAGSFHAHRTRPSSTGPTSVLPTTRPNND